MTWTIWDAPSDRDYYDQLGLSDLSCEDDEPPEDDPLYDDHGDRYDESDCCQACGATPKQAHEEWCPYWRNTAIPAGGQP